MLRGDVGVTLCEKREHSAKKGSICGRVGAQSIARSRGSVGITQLREGGGQLGGRGGQQKAQIDAHVLTGKCAYFVVKARYCGTVEIIGDAEKIVAYAVSAVSTEQLLYRHRNYRVGDTQRKSVRDGFHLKTFRRGDGGVFVIKRRGGACVVNVMTGADGGIAAATLHCKHVCAVKTGNVTLAQRGLVDVFDGSAERNHGRQPGEVALVHAQRQLEQMKRLLFVLCDKVLGERNGDA